jgi:hypothetical protein
MLTTCVDPHIVLTDALAALHVDGQKPSIVKSRLSTVRAQVRPVRFALVLASMAVMVVDIWQAVRRSRHVVVREFWNVPLFCFAFLLFPLRKRVLFNINHNLSGLPRRFPFSILILGILGFRFMLFDGEAALEYIPRRIRRAFAFPLFPCMPRVDLAARSPRVRNVRPVVAVVGDLRSEKGDAAQISKILSALALDQRWDIFLGHRRQLPMQFHLAANITLVSTASHDKYLELLSIADVVVVFAERDRYFCRHSGTIMDAITCGAIPLVPALPVFASQVGNPAKVGETYRALGDLEDGINRAISLSRNLTGQRNQYFRARGLVNVPLF